jgi:hypothetical protein
MDCPKCGAANGESAVFCIICGANISQDGSAQPIENTAETGAVPPQSSYLPPNARPASQIPYGFAPQPYAAPPVYTRPVKAGDKNHNWRAVCSMICGIASVPMMITAFGGLFTAIAAVIFSIRGFKSQKKGMAIAGIICGIVGFLLSGIMVYIMVIGQVLAPELYL